jgi:hypothetical protein
MDPITNLIVSSAIGGAAGSFIKEITSNGVKWLVELVTAQSPEMQAAAKKNMENFIARLAQRVERLESEIPADKSELFRASLNHPSSALLIKTAIIDSAITDNNEKHELLAELIAQRLIAEADDMLALAGTAACQVVNSLTSRQIKILSVLSTLKCIRPLKKANIEDPTLAKNHINEWWKGNIEPLISDKVVNQITFLDYEHLAAMGCIRISIGSSNLIQVISSGITGPDINLAEIELRGQSWFDTIEKQWEGLGHSTPTTIGQLIGILHRDAKLKTKTEINW